MIVWIMQVLLIRAEIIGYVAAAIEDRCSDAEVAGSALNLFVALSTEPASKVRTSVVA